MTLDRDGYLVIEQIFPETICDELTAALPKVGNSGTRRILDSSPFRELPSLLRKCPKLRELLKNLVAVEGIYFNKTPDQNWAVSPHRDTILPVKGSGPWPSAGIKEGLSFAKIERATLDQCLALRIQLDGAPVEDISLVPGSHLDSHSYERQFAIPIPVPRGAALVLRPSLVHASSKLSTNEPRRVLHIVFAMPDLPKSHQWHYQL